MAKSGIDKTPEMLIHPAVWSAMDAFTKRKGKPDDGKEKGFLLAGTVSKGGMLIEATHTIIFPQMGDGGAVDFNASHTQAPRFWASVQTFLKKNKLTLIGWAHYFSGGVHHSHTDDKTDALLAEMTKSTSPVMVSMTWNEKRAGVEAKLWLTTLDGDEVQAHYDNVPIKYLYNDSVVENYIASVVKEMKVGIRFTLGDGIRFTLPAGDAGLTEDVLREAVLRDFRANTNEYLAVKEENIGEKLWAAMREKGVDPEVVKFTHDQLDRLWIPVPTANKWEQWDRFQTEGSKNGKGAAAHTTVSALDTEEKLPSWAYTIDDSGDVYYIMTEEEAKTWMTGDLIGCMDGYLCIVDNEREVRDLADSFGIGRWNLRTNTLRASGLTRGEKYSPNNNPGVKQSTLKNLVTS